MLASWLRLVATYRNIINGLKLFAAIEGEDAHVPGADHDVIYGPELEEGQLTQEQLAQLEEWGWHLSEESGGWQHFV